MDAMKAITGAKKLDGELVKAWKYIRDFNGGIIWALLMLGMLAIVITNLLTQKWETNTATTTAIIVIFIAFVPMALISIGYRSRKQEYMKEKQKEHLDREMEIGRRSELQIHTLKAGYAKELEEQKAAFHNAEQRWITLATKLNLGRAYDAFGGKEPYEVHELAVAMNNLKAKLHIPAVRYPLANAEIFQKPEPF